MNNVSNNRVTKTGMPKFKEEGGTSIPIWLSCAGCEKEVFYGNGDGDAVDWPVGLVIEGALLYCATCQKLLDELTAE